ncbi:MAG: hypothetical protein LBU99_05140 [Spirochaetaceae bacterium]|nr:hypothetical protein [Spirochaetaceae bacterium]
MKVLEIKDMLRKEVPLYYRMDYTGTAVVEIPLKVIEAPVEFTIETDPLGRKTIELTLKNDIDYPLVPLVKSLKEYILELSREGLLPL